MADVAISRLQGKLAKDGRELTASPKQTSGKLFSTKANVVRSSKKTKGEKINFLIFLSLVFQVPEDRGNAYLFL